MIRSVTLSSRHGLCVRSASLFSALAVALLAAGCGNPGAPLPPSLHIPEPVTDLSASRTGNTVSLHWTMTRRNTERLLLKGDQRAVVCRATGRQLCAPVATLLVSAAEPASYDDALPPVLRTGAPQLLRYEVRLLSPRGRDAGPSSAAFAAAGAAPPPLSHVEVQATARGILIQWSEGSVDARPPMHASLLARVQRDSIVKPGEDAQASKSETRNGVPQPLQQMLEAAEHMAPESTEAAGWTPDHTLDTQAALNRTYRYTVQLVERMTLEGHALELAGEPAHSANTAMIDRFPPATPTELNAVANPDGRPVPTIDLSWSPADDQDVAGYFVYRREVTADKPVRVSGKAPVPLPAWSDATARPGVRYAYSVSSVDLSGNESARSAEALESIPIADGQPPQP